MRVLKTKLTLKWHRFKNWCRLKLRWLIGHKVTRATVIADAKSLHPGAIVLYDYNEMIKFAYEFLIREKIFKPSELTKFIQRGDRIIKHKINEQNRKQTEQDKK